ncbi:MAG: serine/threonine protein kinase [Myxococcales bacterium]|nr:MAG: serine/threonine protein kinase [Myxococcales bacterium]
MRRCLKCGTEFAGSMAFCGNDGSVLVAVMPAEQHDSRLGQRLGDYVLAAPIADGATGRVYEGRNANTREKVAVKVLHDDVSKDHVAVERFRREAEAGMSMSHSNIVKVIDSGQTADGSHFMTMEFLDGEELGEVFRRSERLSVERVIRIVCQIAIALDYAHSYGYVHRDLKPDNIFLCSSEQGDVVKLLDFGSVKMQVQMGPKLTAIGTTLGSPFYMSPEQAMGKQDVDQRSDVFALGAILHEMFTGEVAFGASTVGEVLMKILQQQPAPVSRSRLDLPAAVDGVIATALAKDKTARYPGALQTAAALCSSFGLGSDVEHWYSVSQAELTHALLQATQQNGERDRMQLAQPASQPLLQHEPLPKLSTHPELDDTFMADYLPKNRFPMLALSVGLLHLLLRSLLL